ncbi:uncharacterized protein [Amphiura filiformis]|uniref:uncharacterized protein n=1 Tax=Amphiura filiformis TaxID=82378 RepID=UPI003B21C27D
MLGQYKLILLGIFTLILHDVYAVDVIYECIDPMDGTPTVITDLTTEFCEVSEGDKYAIIAVTVTQSIGDGDNEYTNVHTKWIPDADAATEGEDYYPYVTLTPIPSTASATFRSYVYIPIIDDNVIEETERFTLNDISFTTMGNNEVACMATCTLYIHIIDNDMPCVSFDNSVYIVPEDGTPTP